MEKHFGPATPPPRSLGLQGASNFRDLGDYLTRDGRRVRPGLLYRSSHLGALTGADREALARLGLRTVCDLRGAQESRLAPPAIAGARHRPCPIAAAILPKLRATQAAGHALDADSVAALMAEAYRGYVHSWSAAFRALFELLLAGEVPLVFHCAAGKDRTGVAAALVLTALDVPRETVLHDYLLSRLFWREDEAAHAAFPAEAVRIAGGVDERFLAAAFEAMDSGYGGSDGYLQHALGMGPEERRVLAGLYLAPAA